MATSVWCVGWIDSVVERDARKVEREEKWTRRYEATFATKQQALAFLVDRATRDVEGARQSVLNAERRLKRCQKRLEDANG